MTAALSPSQPTGGWLPQPATRMLLGLVVELAVRGSPPYLLAPAYAGSAAETSTGRGMA
ncbi:MAG: hypothetical protein U0836_23050 [Pirellulales bacterium]